MCQGLFHETSKYIYDWMSAQPRVKEESLTDWFLYNVSSNDKRIFYKAFTRNEESQNGADWEWWVVVNHPSDTMRGQPLTYAFRFLIQAKKLKSSDDNYSLLAYANKHGVQMDLLMSEAAVRAALPLYMFYSTSRPDYTFRNKYKHCIDVKPCQNCINGGFLALAGNIQKMVFGGMRPNIVSDELLGQAFPMSILDFLLTVDTDLAYRTLWELNRFYLDSFGDDRPVLNPGGFMHRGTRIPDYLQSFITATKEGKNDWFESEMRSEYGSICGLGVIDLRN